MTSLSFNKKHLTPQGPQEEAPVIQLITHLLLKAQSQRASDLHLEPLAHAVRVRVRIDGVLQETQRLPKKLQEALVNRLKIMSASMNIAEKRLPQEGRFQFPCEARTIDIRISTIPTVYGESVVLRFLDRSSLILGLAQLGLEKKDQLIVKKLIAQPHGLLLVTGPTGSGKTTTLYTCLQELNHPDCKIITVEDPVEYQLPGINQVQVQQEIGRTFPAVLRAMLRQSTNKIMVGEIRDSETARIAMNASLTGHLILSTLHTNDAPSTIARLEDMGIPLFLIASGLHAVIAQRLVRRLCPHCKVPTTFTKYEQKILAQTLDARLLQEPKDLMNTALSSNSSVGSVDTHSPHQNSSCIFSHHASPLLRYDQHEKSELPREEKPPLSSGPMQASGCKKCDGKGFQGRLGIFEIFILNDFLRHDIHQKKTTSHLREEARKYGMKTLREDGFHKVLAGLTTLEEVLTKTLE